MMSAMLDIGGNGFASIPSRTCEAERPYGLGRRRPDCGAEGVSSGSLIVVQAVLEERNKSLLLAKLGRHWLLTMGVR